MLRNISFLKSGKINPDFLIEAMKSCKLPGDIETYQELKKTLDYLTDKKEKFQPVFQKAKRINWDLISKIPSICRVKISTGSGDIVLRRLVNHTPATVSNFLELIKKGFFTGSIFHRVVPNFVIQGGCSRGDGWGGPGYIIRSEFYPDYYREGSVGMASAGKDTEGSQWFITHSPTSHLDGRYTLFGFVESGMNVVHKIGLGSKIFSIKIVEEKKAIK